MDLLDRLLGHDRDSTRQILDIAAALDERQLDREFDIGHRTIRRTLEHVVWNVECWTDLMQGRPVRSRPAGPESVAALRRRLDDISAEFFALARRIVDERRLDETFLDRLDDPPKEKTFGGAIVHLATHGMHHRAQLLYMLRLLGVKNLPEGDVLAWEESLADG